MEFQKWWDKNKYRYLKFAKTNYMDFYVLMAIRIAAEDAWNVRDSKEPYKCHFCGKKLDDGYLRCDDCRYAG